MGDELVVAVDGAMTQAERIFNGLMAAIENPAFDPAKLKVLADLQTEIIDRQRKQEFQAAKMQAIMAMPVITKDGAIKNKDGKVQSRFATFENIDRIVRPICAAHNLGYSFNPQQSGAMLSVTCVIAHTNGHSEEVGPMPIAIDTTGSKNATQGAGSAVTYGKRYTLCAAFNIITEGADNDGANSDDGEQPWQTLLLDDARRAAQNGASAYANFFKALTNMKRGWLVDQGHHDANKKAAESHAA